MPVYKYVEESNSATNLATKRLIGVAPEVNLGEYVTNMLTPSMIKAAHTGFETQRRC